MHRRLGTRKEPNSLYISGVIWNLDWFCGGRLSVLKNFCNFTKVSYCWGFSWAKRFGGQNRRCKNTNWIVICTNKHSSLHDLYIRTLAGTNGSIQKGSPRNSPLHSVRAGEDHIHKGENFHPRVVNCVSACTTITDKILTLSFFLLFFQQFWSWSCTASTTTQCLILTDFISFLNMGPWR